MKQLSHVLIQNLLERCFLSLTKMYLNEWKLFPSPLSKKKKKIPLNITRMNYFVLEQLM